MTHQCAEPGEVARIADLSAGDPARTDYDACPRCRELVAAYEVFLTRTNVPGANVVDADARLSRFIAETIGGDAGVHVARARPSRGHVFARTMAALVARPLWAAAAVAVVVVGAVLWQPWQGDNMVLRSGRTSANTVVAESAERLSDRSLLLSWRGVAGADAYEVRLYSGGLDELLRLPQTTDTSLVITAGELAAAGDVVFYEIAAFELGDEIAVSAPGMIDPD